MYKNFYRFRSLDWLLGGEIENLSIYLTEPEKLNDPLEGFKNIYWKGDEIVWKNLFRHYARCVSFQYYEFVTGVEELIVPSTLDWSGLSDDLREVVDYAVGLFLEDAVTRKYIEIFARDSRKIYQSELKVYLYSCHHFAVYCVQRALVQFGVAEIDLSAGAGLNEARLDRILRFAEIVSIILKAPGAEREVKEFFDKLESNAEEAHVLAYVNQGLPAPPEVKRNANMQFDFVSNYMKSLERLMYPNWYVACFMTDCSNSSIWGTYGEKHSGACLKYRIPEVDSQCVIPLKKPDCFPEQYQDTNLRLSKVSYNTAPIEMSFFESITNVPERLCIQDWFTDGDQTTPMRKWLDDFSVSEFNAALTISTASKLDAWQHENEYRAVLTSFADISAPECRVFTYDFEILEGIIFGIKMTLENKAAIVSKFLVHIRRAEVTHFKFYQAYFDQASKSIKYKELSLLMEQLGFGAS